MAKDYSVPLQTCFDFFLVLCVAIGIYSQSSSMVSHYILGKKIIK